MINLGLRRYFSLSHVWNVDDEEVVYDGDATNARTIHLRFRMLYFLISETKIDQNVVGSNLDLSNARRRWCKSHARIDFSRCVIAKNRLICVLNFEK